MGNKKTIIKKLREFKEKKIEKIELNKENIKKEFKNYLLSSGFPEIVANQEQNIKYLNGVIDKVIDSDIPKVFDVKNSSEIRAVFNVIYNDPGQMIEIQELSNELNLNRNKLSLILEYLEKSFLIKKLYNFSKNARKIERKLKKFYPMILNPYLIEDYFPKIFETSMVINLDANFFWRDSYKNEVDIVKVERMGKKQTIQGIEIKSGEIKKQHLKPLEIFKKKFKADVKIISYDIKAEFENIKVIPFYEFLLKKHN